MESLPLMCLQVANIVANNASLVLISLSLNQIIRSGIPIITAILGIVIEHSVTLTDATTSSPAFLAGCLTHYPRLWRGVAVLPHKGALTVGSPFGGGSAARMDDPVPRQAKG